MRFSWCVSLAALALLIAGYSSIALAADRPVNLLFLMTDQHHYQALGCAGNAIIKTPALDSLAAGGTRFTNSFCVVPYCSPTRAAIVTGRYPSSLGLGRNIAIGPNAGRDALRLHEPIETYMHHLAAAGYHCHQLGKWHVGVPAQLACFPDAKQDDEAPYKMANDRMASAGKAALDDASRPGEVERFGHKSFQGDVWMRREIADAYHKLHFDLPKLNETQGVMGRSVVKSEFWHEYALADYCIDLLKRHKNEPFAITYSVSPPHEPFIAPAPFYDMYDPAAFLIPATWSNHPAEWAKTGAARIGAIYGEAGLREHLRCYYARVTMMDQCFGRILKALDELGLADRTLVIFTSDHGTNLGQHGMIEKATEAFYDDLTRVPLILRLPGRIAAGKTCDAGASSVDLAPTILDLLGGTALPSAHGRSLRPFLDGQPADARPVFGERGDIAIPQAAARFIRAGQWKFAIYARGNMKALYDMEHDPAELHNLADDPSQAPLIEKLSAQLFDHMRAVGDQALPHFKPRS